MATVATGMPRGIWTIDSSESIPPRCWVGIGTPMTGSERLGGEHPGQVGGPAGAGDDDPEATPGCLLRVAEQRVRRPMGGHDPQLGRHVQLHEDRAGRLQDREVRAAAADDADDRRSAALHHRRLPSFVIVQPAQPVAGRAGGRQRRRPGPRPIAVRWPILRRSNTRRLSYRWRWTVGSAMALSDETGSSRAVRERPRPPQVDHGRRRERVGRAEPSPQIARMCCSNCEVAAPSSVQWPLLWTRGASSLTTSAAVGHEEQLGGQRAGQAHRDGQPLPEVGRPRGDVGVDVGRARRSRRGSPRRGRCGRAGSVASLAVDAARDDDRELRREGELALGEERPRRRGGPSRVQRPGELRRSMRPGSGRDRRSRRSPP